MGYRKKRHMGVGPIAVVAVIIAIAFVAQDTARETDVSFQQFVGDSELVEALQDGREFGFGRSKIVNGYVCEDGVTASGRIDDLTQDGVFYLTPKCGSTYCDILLYDENYKLLSHIETQNGQAAKVPAGTLVFYELYGCNRQAQIECTTPRAREGELFCQDNVVYKCLSTGKWADLSNILGCDTGEVCKQPGKVLEGDASACQKPFGQCDPGKSTCLAWSDCVNGRQLRECRNDCGIEKIENRACTQSITQITKARELDVRLSAVDAYTLRPVNNNQFDIVVHELNFKKDEIVDRFSFGSKPMLCGITYLVEFEPKTSTSGYYGGVIYIGAENVFEDECSTTITREIPVAKIDEDIRPYIENLDGTINSLNYPIKMKKGDRIQTGDICYKASPNQEFGSTNVPYTWLQIDYDPDEYAIQTFGAVDQDAPLIGKPKAAVWMEIPPVADGQKKCVEGIYVTLQVDEPKTLPKVRFITNNADYVSDKKFISTDDFKTAVNYNSLDLSIETEKGVVVSTSDAVVSEENNAIATLIDTILRAVGLAPSECDIEDVNVNFKPTRLGKPGTLLPSTYTAKIYLGPNAKTKFIETSIKNSLTLPSNTDLNILFYDTARNYYSIGNKDDTDCQDPKYFSPNVAFVEKDLKTTITNTGGQANSRNTPQKIGPSETVIMAFCIEASPHEYWGLPSVSSCESKAVVEYDKTFFRDVRAGFNAEDSSGVDGFFRSSSANDGVAIISIPSVGNGERECFNIAFDSTATDPKSTTPAIHLFDCNMDMDVDTGEIIVGVEDEDDNSISLAPKTIDIYVD